MGKILSLALGLLLGVAIGGYGVNALLKPEPPPVPAGASETAQQSIAAFGPGSVAERKLLRPGTPGQWEMLISARAEQTRPIASMEQESAVSIEADVIAGVPVYRIAPRQADSRYREEAQDHGQQQAEQHAEQHHRPRRDQDTD